MLSLVLQRKSEWKKGRSKRRVTTVHPLVSTAHSLVSCLPEASSVWSAGVGSEVAHAQCQVTSQGQV